LTTYFSTQTPRWAFQTCRPNYSNQWLMGTHTFFEEEKLDFDV
jgi:hypothetical protein